MRKNLTICLLAALGATACATVSNEPAVVVSVSTMAVQGEEATVRAAVTIERPSNPGLQVIYEQPLDNPPLKVGERVQEYGRRVVRQ